MSYLNALAGLPWDWVSLGGACGGVLNAAVSSNLNPLPVWSKTVRGHGIGHVTRVGLLVSIAVGAIASSGLLWVLHGMADFDDVPSGDVPLRLVVVGVFVGFITARGLTSEVDKVLLRLAVRSAAVAPAAHPDIADAIEHAPPYAVYEMAAELAPRRNLSALERLRVASGFERVHAQRL